MTSEIQVRKGNATDIHGALQLIQELATYERAPHEVIVTEDKMKEWGFGNQPLFEFFVAEYQSNIVGIALFYIRYSTWKGPMIYLEDIVVKEEFRRHGIGHLLFKQVSLTCKERNYFGMTWQVLDWNTPAIAFYEKYGSEISTEWYNGKLTAEQISKLSWNK
jgi:GNAT superfamily N-acetyltransferase